MTAWVRSVDTGGTDRTVCACYLTGQKGTLWRNIGGKQRLFYINASLGGEEVLPATGVADAAVHHVGVAYDNADPSQGGANSLRSYVDGVEVGLATNVHLYGSPDAGTTGWRWGQRISADFPYSGEMGELCHWSRRLDAKEFKALAMGASPKTIAGLIGFWPCFSANDNNLNLHRTISLSGGTPLTITGTLASAPPLPPCGPRIPVMQSYV